MKDCFNGIFARFTDMQSCDENDESNRASPRIKILIQNLLANKLDQWRKVKDEKKIQTKDEVARAVLKQD